MEQGSQEWLEARKLGIGASEVAAALGLSQYKSQLELYYEKTDPEFRRDDEVRHQADVGLALEPYLAKRYERETGNVLLPKPPAIVYHKDYPWIFASLDGWTTTRLVDYKTTLYASTGHLYGEPGTDKIPIDFLCQAHQQLAVAPDKEACDMFVMFREHCATARYTIVRDDALYETMLVGLTAFWQRVVNRTPPPPRDINDAQLRWGRKSAVGTVTATPDDLRAIERLKEIREDVSRLKKEDEELRGKLMASFADVADEMVSGNGQLLATWKMIQAPPPYMVTRKASRRLDIK